MASGGDITVMSYCGELRFGVVADRDLDDDTWPLADALRHAQEELLALVPDLTAAREDPAIATP